MKIAPNKAKFSKLNNKEKLSKLFQLFHNNEKLYIWEKGKKVVFKCEIDSQNNLLIKLKQNHLIKELNDSAILYSFEINGVRFFGSANLLKEENEITLDCSAQLFKYERRSNFRMLSYPQHKIYALFSEKTFSESSNVIDFRVGRSITDIFKEFANLVGLNLDLKEGYIPIRIIDISLTGFSIHIGELEKDLFPENSETGKFYINFNGHEFEVPNAKVIYVKEVKSQVKNIDVIKVGFQFLEIDINFDNYLGSIIYDAVRDFTSEFEKYIL